MIIQQLSVFVENKPGRVAAIVKALGDSGVDLSALSLADTAQFGIMRLIVDDLEGATQTLDAVGIVYKLTDVLAVHLEDQPGGLATVLSVLNQENIGVNYMYAFISKEEGTAMMVLRVDNTAEAAELLISKGFTSGAVK